MQRILMLVAGLLVAANAQAIEIVSARWESGAVLARVTHSGGCGEHHYSLRILACRTRANRPGEPQSCTAQLVDRTSDTCDMATTRDVRLEVPGTADMLLTIQGETNSVTLRVERHANHGNNPPIQPGLRQCEQLALGYVRAVTGVDMGRHAGDVQYSVTEPTRVDSRADGREVTVTARAFGLHGEDSDTYRDYEVVLHGLRSGACANLISMRLVGEN